MAARSAEHVHFLNKPMPFAFCFAALFLAAATRDLNLCWPFLRLPPTKRAFFAFFAAFFFAGFFFAAVFCAPM